MKKISISKEKFALVDDEDFEFLNKWKWKYHKDEYAVRTITGGKQAYMHRIANNTPKGLITDHINRNGLDNRKRNLRTATLSQNGFNTGIWKHNTSGAKGVYWSKQRNRRCARAGVNRKNVHLGFYLDIKDAAKARINFERLNYAI